MANDLYDDKLKYKHYMNLNMHMNKTNQFQLQLLHVRRILLPPYQQYIGTIRITVRELKPLNFFDNSLLVTMNPSFAENVQIHTNIFYQQE